MNTWDAWYRGRSALVVGGLGFVGLNVSRRLAALGATVGVVTPRLVAHSTQAADLESAGARILEADVRDADRMRAAVAGRDVVFNLAGRSGAVRSLEDPFTDLDVNCRGRSSCSRPCVPRARRQSWYFQDRLGGAWMPFQ
jgi:UDP-glucose 4-epimerase